MGASHDDPAVPAAGAVPTTGTPPRGATADHPHLTVKKFHD